MKRSTFELGLICYENINSSALNNVLRAASSIQADEDVELAG